MFLYFDKKT